VPRVRFAPSPTGNVHIGNIRTAIFNWLFARHEGGAFLLRVEDTDRERSTPEALASLLDVMEWLGLDYDGEPLYQSQRADAHLAAAEQLITAGQAYRDGDAIRFRIPCDSPSYRDDDRIEQEIHPDVPLEIDNAGLRYALISRKGKAMPQEACLAGFHGLKVLDPGGQCIFDLDAEFANIQAGGSSTLPDARRIRFQRREVVYQDLVKGELAKPLDSMKDQVIVRSDGSPVFHLANVCDDIEMRISHVIRGDDHVENTYRHLLLFQALGAEPPAFAHLPMIVNKQGKPYSKRDGDAFVGDFRAKGYEPEALFNYLALLGWSPGGDLERMSKTQMAELFTLDRVKSSPAQMDPRKLLDLNGHRIAAMDFPSFLETARRFAESAWTADAAYFEAVAELMQTRTKLFPDVANWAFFFVDEPAMDEKANRKFLGQEGIHAVLADLATRFADLAEFAPEDIESAIHAVGDTHGIGRGKLNQPLRVALTGITVGAGVYETAAVLGRARVAARLQRLRDLTD
jgi:glutamyl-tRNA synthetase